MFYKEWLKAYRLCNAYTYKLILMSISGRNYLIPVISRSSSLKNVLPRKYVMCQ